MDKRANQYNTYLIAQRKAEENLAKFRNARDSGKYSISYLNNLSAAADKSAQIAKEEYEKWNFLVKTVSDYDKALEGMAENINVGALVNDPGKSDKAYEEAKKKAEEYAEYIKR